MDFLLKRIQNYKLWHSFCKVLVFKSRVTLGIQDFRNQIIFVHPALNINRKNKIKTLIMFSILYHFSVTRFNHNVTFLEDLEL